MNIGVFGHGYQLIGSLILAGVGLLVVSLGLNRQIEASVRNEVRHQEKRYEYYRSTATQLGMLLIGIGVSLFVFFVQQHYQDERQREGEIRQVLAKLASRVGRASAHLEFLPEYDAILDDGGPYMNPEDGGNNRAVTASGADLAKQVQELRLVERDVPHNDFGDLDFSTDLQGSPLLTELDPAVWFTMHRDESELKYAIVQLSADFKDLHAAVGDADPVQAVADAATAAKVKQEVLDVLYDLDLLRDRSRRVFARACWFMSQGRDFVSLHPMEAIRKRYKSHQEWIEQAKLLISPYRVGGENCFAMLSYKEPGAAAASATKESDR
jgi:hypothetical protein